MSPAERVVDWLRQPAVGDEWAGTAVPRGAALLIGVLAVLWALFLALAIVGSVAP